MNRWLVLLAFTLVAPTQAPRTDELPVHATLRLASERSSFKNGEPIRLELLLTADKPGFVADTMGADEASDRLIISPEAGVHRHEGIGGRDVMTAVRLTTEPTVVPLTLNYWVRFDRPGTYTAAFDIRRVSSVGPNGEHAFQPRFALTSNSITFRIEPTSETDEQELIASAERNLESSLMLGRSDSAWQAQVHAAEELAFLPGDAAAIEKYRWFKELGTRRESLGNGREVLRRGFRMSRNPAVILAEIEAELQDVDQTVSSELIMNAASLAVEIKHPDVRQNTGVPMPPGSPDPISVERRHYIDVVHQSLERRRGLTKYESAGAILDMLVALTPPDVVALIVEGFDQLPPDRRSWFASGRWEVIRSVKLAPALRRTLDEVEPGSRSYLFPALIDIAPGLAVEPLSTDILDPKRLISAEIVRKLPRSSLSQFAPQLVAVIRKMSEAPTVDTFRLDRKIELLGIIGDATVLNDVRQLYDTFPKRYAYGTRESLLRYLLEFDPDVGTQRLKAAIESDQSEFLYKIVHDGPPLPALTTLLQDRLFDRDLKVAGEAATYLPRDRQESRDAIDRRLLQWRVDRQLRLANGEALTEADGAFESALVRPLANGPVGKLAATDRERLLAACLTPACKALFRER